MEDALAPFLLLQRLPVLADAARSASLDVAEDVRVAPDELLMHGAGHLLQVSVSTLREQQGQEVHLEEQITELVEQLLGLIRKGCVRDLIGLFDRVRHDRPRGLLAVPGTVPPQALSELLQLEERVGQRQRYCCCVPVLPVSGGE